MVSRSGRRQRGRQPHPPLDLDRARGGAPVRHTAADGDWLVRHSAPAAKTYLCPGCQQVISAGTPTLVAWPADGLLGEAAALADRRHWHHSCWRERSNRR